MVLKLYVRTREELSSEKKNIRSNSPTPTVPSLITLTCVPRSARVDVSSRLAARNTLAHHHHHYTFATFCRFDSTTPDSDDVCSVV